MLTSKSIKSHFILFVVCVKKYPCISYCKDYICKIYKNEKRGRSTVKICYMDIVYMYTYIQVYVFTE